MLETLMMKAASKREQCQDFLSIAEREQTSPIGQGGSEDYRECKDLRKAIIR